MAIAATALASSITTTDAASYNTASISPAANSLLLVFAASSVSAGTAPTITVSGLSLTWTEQIDYGYDPASPVRRITASTAQCGASPGSGALTLTMSGTSTHAAWLVIEITGHDTTTPVPQAVANGASSGTAGSVTLASPVSADSRSFSWWGLRANSNISPDTSWSELFDGGISSPSMTQEGQWRSDAFDTSCLATMGTSARWAGIALEIAADAGGGTDAEVTAVAATATGTASPAPALSAGSTVTGVAATATATAQAPAASASSTVAAVVATSTATAQAPTVAAGAVVQAVVATATADAIAPAVDGDDPNATVDAVTATATADAGTPAVSAGAVVAAVVATATASAGVPDVTGGSESVTNVDAVVATATSTAPAPTVTADATVVATSTHMGFRGERVVVTTIENTYTFQPPTYEVQVQRPPMVHRPRMSITKSMSVVRINGTLQTFKTPSNDMLRAAGVEGEDYFLGGRTYQVSAATKTELQNAGYTVE